jgi:hypothetical protein
MLPREAGSGPSARTLHSPQLHGRILNLQVVSGYPLLVPSALAAVKQWVFKPTLVNGNAVDMNTPVYD